MTAPSAIRPTVRRVPAGTFMLVATWVVASLEGLRPRRARRHRPRDPGQPHFYAFAVPALAGAVAAGVVPRARTVTV
jgi:hypothetical protein